MVARPLLSEAAPPLFNAVPHWFRHCAAPAALTARGDSVVVVGSAWSRVGRTKLGNHGESSASRIDGRRARSQTTVLATTLIATRPRVRRGDPASFRPFFVCEESRRVSTTGEAQGRAVPGRGRAPPRPSLARFRHPAT